MDFVFEYIIFVFFGVVFVVVMVKFFLVYFKYSVEFDDMINCCCCVRFFYSRMFVKIFFYWLNSYC